MTPEQKQRIVEIEARQPERAEWQYGKDIDFLLSLVKSQEAVGRCVSCGHDNYDADRGECIQRWMEGRMSVVCGCPCAKHGSLDNAINRMRSACIEKVKAMRDEWQRRADAVPLGSYEVERFPVLQFVSAAVEIISALESATIQEQEK